MKREIPSNPAVVSEIDGVVTFGGIKRGNREIFIESKDGVKKRYLVSLSKHILVQDNDFVKAGYALSDGATTPSDILSIKGPTACTGIYSERNSGSLPITRCED